MRCFRDKKPAFWQREAFSGFVSTSGNTFNVGIGTMSPTEKLQVYASSNSISLSDALPGYSAGIYGTLKSNGSYIYFSAGNTYSAYMEINGTWHAMSSRQRKENFTEINPQEILTKIDELPVMRWNYKSDDKTVVHIGPVAEDFHAIFGLGGSDDKTIAHIDPPGVALAGIKALSARLKNQQQQIEKLQQELKELKLQFSQRR